MTAEADHAMLMLAAMQLRLDELEAALERIAAPARPDGSYNLSREACGEIARDALGRTSFEPDPELEMAVGLDMRVEFTPDEDEPCRECGGTGCPCVAQHDEARRRFCQDCVCPSCGATPHPEAA